MSLKARVSETVSKTICYHESYFAFYTCTHKLDLAPDTEQNPYTVFHKSDI